MINSKGHPIYTNAEIANELGISPATVNACAKRLFGRVRIPHWTLNDATLIVKYIKSISVGEEKKRLEALHNAVVEIIGETEISDDYVKKFAKNDINVLTRGPEGGV